MSLFLSRENPDDNISDELLARKAQEGNKEAFGELAERYLPKLLRYGHKFLARDEDVEDIVQDVLLRSYASLLSYDPDRRFSPWIYRIAHNAFVNGLRAKERIPLSLPFDTLLPYAVEEATPESLAEKEELVRVLDESLLSLAPQYREILTLYYMEELDYSEIADVLSVPMGTVGVRLARARRKLKEILPPKETLNVS
jgi:RNA polymerase sigma factor (sigma-70 family)